MQTYKRRLSFQLLGSHGNYNVFDFLPDNKHYFFSESVRGGLEFLIDKLCKQKFLAVMLPVFVPEGIISPFKKKGATVVFYKLNSNLSPDIEDIKIKLIKNPGILCIVALHYFGIKQDLIPVKNICEKNQCLLFEDCVHALFSKDENGKYLGYCGDVSFFSFPKILPVPDGAIFFVNNPGIQHLCNEITYRRSIIGYFMVRIHLLYLLIKNLEVKFEYSSFYCVINGLSKVTYFIYYQLLKRTPKPQKISGITLKILRNIDYRYLIKRRGSNIENIYSKQDSIKQLFFLKDYNPNLMLTGVPCVSSNYQRIISTLKRKGIECLSYNKSWIFIPSGCEGEYQFEYRFFKEHFLLPVHEMNTDYTEILTEIT